MRYFGPDRILYIPEKLPSISPEAPPPRNRTEISIVAAPMTNAGLPLALPNDSSINPSPSNAARSAGTSIARINSDPVRWTGGEKRRRRRRREGRGGAGREFTTPNNAPGYT